MEKQSSVQNDNDCFQKMNCDCFLIKKTKIPCYCVLNHSIFRVFSQDKSKTLYTINLSQIVNVVTQLYKPEPELKVILAGGESLTFTGLSRTVTQQWTIALLTDPEPDHPLTMESFTFLQKLGEGQSSITMLAKSNETGQLFAIKAIPKDEVGAGIQNSRVLSEKNVLMRLHHLFIVTLYGCFQSETHFFFVLDYAAGGDLRTAMSSQKFSSKQVALYISEISIALKHLHSIGVMFRDLKPENVLLNSDGHIKLTDFGFAKEVSKQPEEHSFCGTIEYSAPEIITGKPYGSSIDWWALGIIAFELLTGFRPFHGDNFLELSKNIVNGKFYIPGFLDREEQNLIKGLLNKDPEKRLGDDTIFKIDYFKRLDLNQIERGEAHPEYIPKIQHYEQYCNMDILDKFNDDEPTESIHVQGFSWKLESTLLE